MAVNELEIDNGEVARRAYEIWESRGCPPGDGMEDWNAALAELLAASPEENESVATELTENGNEAGIRVWFARVRRKIIGRDG